MTKAPHPIDCRPLAQDQIVVCNDKRYRVDRWMGFNPYYTFYCLEEDAPKPFNKSIAEVFELIRNNKIQIA